MIAGVLNPDRGDVTVGASVTMGGFLPSIRWNSSTAKAPSCRSYRRTPHRRHRCAAQPGGRLLAFTVTTSKTSARAVGWRARSLGAGQAASRCPEPAGARRADQPPGHRDQARPGPRAIAVRGHADLRLARSRLPAPWPAACWSSRRPARVSITEPMVNTSLRRVAKPWPEGLSAQCARRESGFAGPCTVLMSVLLLGAIAAPAHAAPWGPWQGRRHSVASYRPPFRHLRSGPAQRTALDRAPDRYAGHPLFAVAAQWSCLGGAARRDLCRRPYDLALDRRCPPTPAAAGTPAMAASMVVGSTTCRLISMWGCGQRAPICSGPAEHHRHPAGPDAGFSARGGDRPLHRREPHSATGGGDAELDRIAPRATPNQPALGGLSRHVSSCGPAGR